MVSPGSFSAAEQAVIAEVWQRVSEDFAPFDVNVTTIDPGVEALRKTSAGDASYGQRMVISPTNFAGCRCARHRAARGVRFLAGRPAFVFSGGASTKTIAEAVSHEAGHTLGLSHDTDTIRVRTTTTGTGRGRRSWVAASPGRSRSGPVVSTTAQGTSQDDLAIIAGYTGYRPDDHGDSSGDATPIDDSSTTSGVIGTTGDRDVFAVDVDAGRSVSPCARPRGRGRTCSRSLTVRNSAGALIATASPTTPSSWSVSVNPIVPAGRYTIEVDPQPWLTPSTGFSTYGSLGAYDLVVAGPASTVTAITRGQDSADRHAQRHWRVQARGRRSADRHPGDQRWHRPHRN